MHVYIHTYIARKSNVKSVGGAFVCVHVFAACWHGFESISCVCMWVYSLVLNVYACVCVYTGVLCYHLNRANQSTETR